MPLRKDLYINQGTDFSSNISLLSQNGSFVSIANAINFASEFKKSYTSSNSYYLEVNYVNSTSIGVAASANLTSNLEFGRYVYDVIFLDAIGNINRLIEGQIVLTPQVTPITDLNSNTSYSTSMDFEMIFNTSLASVTS